MSKPVVLQVGPYPAWDQEPLHQAFDIRCMFDVENPSSFLKDVGPGNRAMIDTWPNLEVISN